MSRGSHHKIISHVTRYDLVQKDIWKLQKDCPNPDIIGDVNVSVTELIHFIQEIGKKYTRRKIYNTNMKNAPWFDHFLRSMRDSCHAKKDPSEKKKARNAYVNECKKSQKRQKSLHEENH